MLLQPDGSVLSRVRKLAPERAVSGLADCDCYRLVRPLAEIERQAIESAIVLCVGNVKLAAQRLEISRGSLREKLNSYRVRDGETPLPDRRALPKTMAARAGVI